MNLQEVTAPPEVRNMGNGVQPYSETWWHSRSAEDLRLIMNRGPGLGAIFDGATAEVERRARERLHEDEQAAATQDTHNQRMRRIILEALLLACLLIMIAMALLR